MTASDPEPTYGGVDVLRCKLTKAASQGLPLDLVKHASQAFRACRVNLLDPCDLAIQMCAEVTQSGAVFCDWPISSAVVQRGFQLVKGRPRHVNVVVDDDSSHTLAATALHDAALPVIQDKAFALGDIIYASKEWPDLDGKVRIAREGKIVSIACVVRTEALGQPENPDI